MRRGPSVAESAELAGVGTATVDRILNLRGHVTDDMRHRVLEALGRLQSRPEKKRRITFLCESGDSFNRSLTEAVSAVGWRRQDLELAVRTFASMEVQLIQFAQEMEREDTHVVRAASAVRRRGKPVVCLATDLKPFCRNGFVGSDEHVAGAAAAELLGKLIRAPNGRVLFIHCGTYHAAKDREDGFRATLARDFAHLSIIDRLDVRNDPQVAHDAVLDHIRRRGAPEGIYSVAGGNSGVGRALQDAGISNDVIFIGHELNANSRALLASGAMDYLIGRDQEREVMLSLAVIEAAMDGRPHHGRDKTQVRIISRHTAAG